MRGIEEQKDEEEVMPVKPSRSPSPPVDDVDGNPRKFSRWIIGLERMKIQEEEERAAGGYQVGEAAQGDFRVAARRLEREEASEKRMRSKVNIWKKKERKKQG